MFVLAVVATFLYGRSMRKVEYKDVKRIEYCDKTDEQKEMDGAKDMCGDRGVKHFEFKRNEGGSTYPMVECNEKKENE